MMNSEIAPEENKPRNPKLAFFLALIGPGFGQIYNGEIIKGILFILIELLLPVFYGLTKAGVFFAGFIFILIIGFSYRIYLIYDATATAKKLKNFTPKFYNTWYYFLGIIIGIYTILWFYDANALIGLKSFKIPTTANEPTMKVGDVVVGDLQAFDDTKPNYGDIVVFQKKDSLYPWIYRIVGLPNDKIDFQNRFLIINGKKCKTTFVQETKSDEYGVREYEEELPNGHKHKIYLFTKPFEEDENVEHEITIPKNSYYLMGDNRDNAMDSRYIGVLKEDEIKGKVVFSYWGKTSDRINVDFRDK